MKGCSVSIRRARIRTILGLSLPTAITLLVQNLMNLISISMVSHLGSFALAGIAIAGVLFSALVAVLFGIDSGVQALVGRRIGAGHVPIAAAALRDGLAIAFVAGPLLTVLGYVAGPDVLRRVAADPVVAAYGVSYLNAALPMLSFIGANFAFSAYRNGAGTPRYSLLATAIQLPCSVIFSYLLIFGGYGLPRLETVGAGLGASLAAFIAFVVHVVLALQIAPVHSLLHARPSWSGMRIIMTIGAPVSVQQSLVYLGMGVYFAIIGMLGTGEIAAMNVVLTIMLLSILCASGIGLAAATLVAAALGRDDPVDAKRWGNEAACIGALLILPFSLMVVTGPRNALGLFIADQTTISLAATPLSLMALAMSVDAYGRILVFALRGAGATLLVTTVAFVLQWGAQLPLSWLVGVHLGLGLRGMATIRLVLFATESIIVATMWSNGFWSRGIRMDESNS